MGERWRRSGRAARDSVSLEIEGISLLPPIDETDLPAWLQSWLSALEALIVSRQPTAQVSHEHPSLELCLVRRPGLTIELWVVSLEGEPRLVTNPLTIDLVELRAAVEVATKTFLRGAAEAGFGPEALVPLERALREATGRAISPFAAHPSEPWTFRHSVGDVSIELEDRDHRTLLPARANGGLGALLTAGALRVGGTTSAQPPFLALMGLVRRRPSIAAWEVGLATCAALHQRHPGWATNPWVDALFVRCTEGLATSREPLPEVTPPPAPKPSGPRSEPPLVPVGTPRRVTLAPRWSRPVALGEPRGRLTLSSKAVVVHSPHAAHVFSSAGKEWRRVYGARGVAAGQDGAVLVATDETITAFSGKEASARWFRRDGGLRIGPELLQGEHLVTRLSGRGALALSSLTGSEVWRFDPPRSQRSSLSVIGGRLIVGADSGELYGVDRADGQVRFKIRGPAPSPWPVAALQRDAVAVMTSSSQTVILRFAALAGGTGHAGAVAWNRPLPLEQASAPVAARGRLFVAGRAEGRGAVACLSARGEVLWLRSVPLEGATTSLIAWERGVLATDARGGAVRLLPDGDTSWVVGGLEEPLSHRLAPTTSRGVLVVPGVTIRLIDPQSGRVLAATPAEPELTDYAVGRGLTVYSYVEAGALTCYEPARVLAVV